MRNIIVFQHVGHEPLGTLNPMLKAAGFRIKYVNFGRDPEALPSLDGYNGLVILGGPMGVEQAHEIPHLRVEMKLVEEALKKDIPILGICLGSQIIANVLGAKVQKAPEKEIGWYDLHLTDRGKTDPLFSHFDLGDKVFQIHEDTFEIPKATEHLAWSNLCQGQAFRYGKKVYGFQFHLEVDKPMIHRWLKVPGNVNMLKELHGKVTTETIEKETEQLISRNLLLSQETFKKWIEIFNLPERPLILGSEHAKPRKARG